MSLNGGSWRVPLPHIDAGDIRPTAPFVGARPSDWRPRDSGVTVDDRDPSFSVVQPPARGWRSVFRRKAPDATATRMASASFGGWRRHSDGGTVTWGRHRRSLMWIPAGAGATLAVFSAELPVAGKWRLLYHLPGPSLRHGRWDAGFPGTAPSAFGALDLHIVADGQRLPASFDAAQGIPGWNAIGTFDLPAGATEVTVSDKTSGDMVVADAIRWVSVAGSAKANRANR